VFTMGDADPVKAGMVASLARPGGNITGISLLAGELGVKRLEILRELIPTARSIGVLVNPLNRNVDAEREELQAAIMKGGQRALIVASDPSEDIDVAVARLSHERIDALLLTADPTFTNRRVRIAALTARYRIPTI
jgi:putative ABC transport system substrate-binding protein